MRLRKSLFAVMASLVLATTGCDEDDSGNGGLADRDDQFGELTFSGYVYDGVTGARLPDYELTLWYANTSREARVRDGRYVVTGLPTGQDFSIEITAGGYRRFVSHNEMANFDPFDYEFADGVKSYIFMAYLYPEATQAPQTDVHVQFNDAQGPVAAGTVRLRPTEHSTIIDDDDSPAGVGDQVWENDEDLLAATVTAQISNGLATFAAGTLLYGVEYDVDIFGVTGYEINEGTTLVAGDDAFVDVWLDKVDPEPLRVLWHNAGVVQSSAGALQFVVVFNRPVTFDQNFLEGHYLNILDQSTAINLEDTDMDAAATMPRALNAANQAAERGLVISGYGTNTLTFTLTRAGWFLMDDPGDRVSTVVFDDLDQLLLRPVGSTNTNESVALTAIPSPGFSSVPTTVTLQYDMSL